MKKGLYKKIPILYAIKQCYQYAPGLSGMQTLFSLLGGILPSLMVYVVSTFINAALSILSDAPEYHALIFSAGMILLYYVFTHVSDVVERYTTNMIQNALLTKYKPVMVEKIASYQYEWLEDREIQDLTQRMFDNMESYFTTILRELNTAVSLIVQTIGILIILALQTWWLVLIFVVIFCPLLFLSFKGGVKIYETDQRATMLTRVIKYLSDILTNRQSAPERILFGYTKKVNEKFAASHLERSNINTEAIAREETKTKLCIILLNIFLVVCLIVLLGNIQSGVLSGGLYVSIIGSIKTLVRSSAVSLSRITINISSHMAFMKDFLRFVSLEGDYEFLHFTSKKVAFQKIEIKDLSFRFPGSEQYVLDHVNMVFENGKSYALIGLNGAGKTTLTRILTGLYTDYEGEILIDGKEQRYYDRDYLRNLFSIVYQDFAKYPLTVRDNITLNEDSTDLSAVVQMAGLDNVIKGLPDGLDTRLGKLEEDGVDVSGGEWQKIAIARALHKGCPFIIMDEPTASLSPTMESALYKQVADISKERTILFISHRLGSTKISDIIYVLADGKVAETGSHQELMDLAGLYAKMFDSQKEWYTDEQD